MDPHSRTVARSYNGGVTCHAGTHPTPETAWGFEDVGLGSNPVEQKGRELAESLPTVDRWVDRCAEHGLAGLETWSGSEIGTFGPIESLPAPTIVAGATSCCGFTRPCHCTTTGLRLWVARFRRLAAPAGEEMRNMTTMAREVGNGRYVSSTGEFTRDQRYITTRITADGGDGYRVEPGRYRLIVSRACPWASRVVIVRRLLGLEDVMSMGIAGPTHDARSWTFDLDPGGRDPVLGIERLQEAYFARIPGYQRGITVPAIVDVHTGQVVTNDFAQITLDLSTQWVAHHRAGAPVLYPEDLRNEIDAVNEVVFADVSNGVYRCGFAGTQEAYDAAYHRLFGRLDWLSARLERQRFLVGDIITEADIRLFTTLVRFDAVYHSHFKCSRQKLTEMPVLWAYARDLFQTPGFGDTVDFQHIKRHYYEVHRDINPTGIVPAGPDLTGWLTRHGRESLGGRPFGDGTPPPPPPEGEQVAVQHTPLARADGAAAAHLSTVHGLPHQSATSPSVAPSSPRHLVSREAVPVI